MNADETEALNVFAYPRSSAFICGHLFSFVPQRNAGLHPS
jgi:hypothetical protein